MPRIFVIHIVALVLCTPLFFAFSISGGTRSDEIWVVGAAVIVYAGVLLTSKPEAVFRGAAKIGLSSKTLKLIMLSTNFIMISIPLLDAKLALLVAVSLACLVFAAVIFLLAVRDAYQER